MQSHIKTIMQKLKYFIYIKYLCQIAENGYKDKFKIEKIIIFVYINYNGDKWWHNIIKNIKLKYLILLLILSHSITYYCN